MSGSQLAETMASDDHGLGCFLDTETTGLSPQYQEIVELSMVLFRFNRHTGEITGVVDAYESLNQPRKSIPYEATAVHGITNQMVLGKKIDLTRVASLVERAEFLMAHNARFDKGFMTALLPSAGNKQWLCSMSGIKWLEKGFPNKKLQDLVRYHRIDPGKAHRASSDVLAAIRLLGTVDKHTGKAYFCEVLAKLKPATAKKAVAR